MLQCIVQKWMTTIKLPEIFNCNFLIRITVTLFNTRAKMRRANASRELMLPVCVNVSFTKWRSLFCSRLSKLKIYVCSFLNQFTVLSLVLIVECQDNYCDYLELNFLTLTVAELVEKRLKSAPHKKRVTPFAFLSLYCLQN